MEVAHVVLHAVLHGEEGAGTPARVPGSWTAVGAVAGPAVVLMGAALHGDGVPYLGEEHGLDILHVERDPAGLQPVIAHGVRGVVPLLKGVLGEDEPGGGGFLRRSGLPQRSRRLRLYSPDGAAREQEGQSQQREKGSFHSIQPPLME